MRSRILLAVVVLGVIVGWARCKFEPQDGVDFTPFFLGCFNGAVTDPPIDAKVTVVFEEATVGTLTGCIQTIVGVQTEFATLSGSLEGSVEQAAVTAMPAGGGAPFDLLVVREPAGAADAVEIDVTNAGGAPFTQAANLPRCNPATTCAALAASMRPVPEPVLELP
jgi:hypothetical protein